MAERISGPSEAERGARQWRRTWFPYEEYINVHLSHMDDLAKRGIVLRDSIEFIERRDDRNEMRFVVVRGRVVCESNVAIAVRKILEARRGRYNRYEVLGIDYSYHAFIRGTPRRDLFRYDNAHGDLMTLHRHVYDNVGLETGLVPVAIEELPRLDLIIETAVAMASAQR